MGDLTIGYSNYTQATVMTSFFACSAGCTISFTVPTSGGWTVTLQTSVNPVRLMLITSIRPLCDEQFIMGLELTYIAYNVL